MKKNTDIIDKTGIALYIIGLFAFPIYKAFIDSDIVFDSYASLWKIVATFILYLIGWWFVYTPVCLLIASLFWKGKEGSDIRMSCFVFFIIVALPALVYIVFPSFFKIKDKIESNQDKKSALFESNSINDDSIVYICTGRTAKKYHSVPDCRWLDNCKGTIEEISLEEAEQYGRTPCRGCCE